MAEAGSLIAGRYRLGRPMTAGGTAEAWRAADLASGRPVAVSLLRAAQPRQASCSTTLLLDPPTQQPRKLARIA